MPVFSINPSMWTPIGVGPLLVKPGADVSVAVTFSPTSPAAGCTAITVPAAGLVLPNSGNAWAMCEYFTTVEATSLTWEAEPLRAYAYDKQAQISGSGITVNIPTSGGATEPIHVDTGLAGQVALGGAVQLSVLNPSQLFNWQQSSGVVVLTATQVQALGLAVGAFVQATYTVLGEVLTAINDGTITTTAGVDTPPSPIAAWPVSS